MPTVVIGLPCRYIHTHVALLHWQDYCQSVQLVLEMVRRLDADTAAGFVSYGA